ncbi:MAG: hypothetical protein GF411_05140 [Candidatus Lokiarchaeota archaeon]|nr:hypothetical protein [Candidatus Lokiarchaeota archaeon]
MSILRKVEIRAHALATEVPERVEEAILNLFPESVQKSITFNRSETEAHHGYRILILETKIKKKKHCQQTLVHLLEALSKSDKTFLMKSIRYRIDDRCKFYLRIDKQQAYLGRVELAKSSDMIRIQFDYINYTGCDPQEIIHIISDIMHKAES